ncbi:DUF3052 domain-containing protein [Streptacidiphilus sp. EB129]|uniref:DUF3052 domain-containing protein n=1 Tax=Streptacidiphilus sp. EB129 TaxID=3156262 RepID=UPI0035186FFC
MSDTGYSGTPLARKLRIKEGHRVALVHPPKGWEIPEPPPGVVVLSGAGPVTDADVTVAFFTSAEQLRAEAAGLVAALRPTGCLWIARPRTAAGHRSDITETLLRELLLPTGVVDVKVAALGTDWSGLAFVWRVVNRPR